MSEVLNNHSGIIQAKNSFFLLITIALIVSCPDPPDELVCGQGMILDADTCACIPNSHLTDDGESCECDSLYHWDDELQDCLLDTSSSMFSWEVHEFGQPFQFIYDIAPSCGKLWVVGDIRTDSLNYNHASYDGLEWSYGQVFFDVAWATRKSSSLFSVGDTGLWMGAFYPSFNDCSGWTKFSRGSTQFSGATDFVGDIKEMKGFVVDDVYLSGAEGSLAHWDGANFTSIESNSDLYFYHLALGTDGATVYILGGSSTRTEILTYSDGQLQSILESTAFLAEPENDQYGFVVGFDTYGDTLYTATFSGLLKLSPEGEVYNFTTWDQLGYQGTMLRDINIGSPNDILITDETAGGIHFNGVRWSQVPSPLEGTSLSQPYVFRTRMYEGVIYGVGYTHSNQQPFYYLGTNKE